jgi:hypothetical protein
MAYRIECSPQYGILLWIDAPCGIKQPLLRWDDLEDVKAFSENLLEFYNHRRRMLNEADSRKSEEYSTTENLLRQALGDDDDCLN